MAENQQQEFDVSNPILGTMSLKGGNIQTFLQVLIALGLVGLSYVMFLTFNVVTEHKTNTATSSVEIVTAVKETAHAIRLQTCLLSLSQEKRELEYTQPNGFCKQMANLP